MAKSVEKRISHYATLFCLTTCLYFDSNVYADIQTLDFPTAYTRVLNGSTQLKLTESDIYGRAADRTQAGLIPNPIFSCEVDNLGTDGCIYDNVQTTFEIEQLIELGGKRQLRTQLSCQQYQAALAEYEIAQYSVLNRLSKAFIAVAAAQEELNLANEQTMISQEVLKTISDKVSHGKISRIQQNKAEIALSSAELEQESAVLALRSAKENLSFLWGCHCPDFEYVVYPFFEVCPPKDLEECLSGFCNRPEIMKAAYNISSANTGVELAKSDRIPDVSVMIGYTATKNCSNRGAQVGVAFPLPIFNRNQGNVARAYSEVFRSQEEAKLVQLLLNSRVSVAHKELLQAYRNVERIRTSILDSAVKTFELAKQGFKEGKYEYLEVLDAQSTLFEIKDRYIDALVTYHNKRADIEYLTFEKD